MSLESLTFEPSYPRVARAAKAVEFDASDEAPQTSVGPRRRMFSKALAVAWRVPMIVLATVVLLPLVPVVLLMHASKALHESLQGDDAA